MEYNKFPKDIKYEIVKNLSSYRTLNKELYRDKVAYEKFCQLPISMNELKNYIETNNHHIYIFTPTHHGLSIIDIYRGFAAYYVLRIKFNRIITQYHKLPYQFKDIIPYINNETYYDMITTYYILTNRDCDEKINIQQITKNIVQFKNDVVSDDIDKFLYNIEKYFYHRASTDESFNITDFTSVISKMYDLNFEDMEKDLMRQLKYL